MPELTQVPIPPIQSPAWLLSGLTRSVPGVLTMTQERLVFDTGEGERLLDAALEELSAVAFPWYYFGGGMKLRIGRETYRLSFARPGNQPDHSGAPDAGDIATARQSAAAWQSALAARITNR